MAKPRPSAPESATNAARKERSDGEGEAAVRESVREHGDDIAAALDASDELRELYTTAVLVVASADDDELDRITESAANLVAAADGLTTAEAAELAGAVGDNAGELSASLEAVVALQRDGHLDDLITLAAAFSESLSSEETERLTSMLEADGAALVDALDAVLELQREGNLEPLLATAKSLSALEVDDDAVEGLNAVLGAVGEAQRESRSVGAWDLLGHLRSKDARAGLGYLVSLLKAQGRRVRRR